MAETGSHLLQPRFPSTQNILIPGISPHTTPQGANRVGAVTHRALGACTVSRSSSGAQEPGAALWERLALPCSAACQGSSPCPQELLFFPISVFPCSCGCSQVCSLPCTASSASPDSCCVLGVAWWCCHGEPDDEELPYHPSWLLSHSHFICSVKQSLSS